MIIHSPPLFSRLAVLLHRLLITAVVGLWSSTSVSGAEATAESVQDILSLVDTSGGLVSYVGASDAAALTELQQTRGWTLHGLTRDLAEVSQLRRELHARGLAGQVVIDHWSAERLPYIDNLLNGIVVADQTLVTEEEMMRVLCPQGWALVRHDTRSTEPFCGAATSSTGIPIFGR